MHSVTAFVLSSVLSGIGYTIGHSFGVSGTVGAVGCGLAGAAVGFMVAVGIILIEDWYLCKRVGITSSIDDMCAWIRKRMKSTR